MERVSGGERTGSPGPIRSSANGRYLVGRDGQPFFWLGDTAWLIAQKARREDVDLYTQTRASQGFTVIQATAVMGMEALGGVAGPNVYGAAPFLETDLTRPNVTPGGNPNHAEEYDYWDHLDYVIRSA